MEEKMKRSRNALAVVLTLSASSLFAHNYLPAPSGKAVTTISDISVSRAAYREIKQKEQVDVYEFPAKKGEQIYIQMTVPRLERLQRFAPEFVLLYTGEGEVAFNAPVVDKGTIADPSHEIVHQVYGAAESGIREPAQLSVAYDGSDPVAFDEPFTGTRYWIRQTLTVMAPADGIYRIGVWSSDGSLGKYVLAPGKAEKFGAADILGLPSVRWQVRVFNEEPVWPDALFWSLVATGVLTAVGFGIYALAH
jgi:hypothetical protein